MAKKITQQLKNLQSIKADDTWKKDSRDFLYSKISIETKNVNRLNFSLLWARDFFKAISQPAFALGAFVLILLTGVIFSHPFLGQAMPNDSLYIARIISEKAQVNMTFNSESRNKLTAKFASDHAKDITAVLSDPEFNHQDNEKTVAKLNESFKKELQVVKDSLGKMSPKDESRNNEGDNVKSQEDDESLVFAVDLSKDENGLEISSSEEVEGGDTEINNDNSVGDNKVDSSDSDSLSDLNEEGLEDSSIVSSSTLVATSTEPIEVEPTDKDDETGKTLEDAENLFDQAKYNEALEKLNELDKIINTEEETLKLNTEEQNHAS
ncbi:MAG: hypothetical protein K9M44_02790 [Candidatus Pacebacteria bacterium]|nr:hypothetical protein [Candidatus Paceibacterota bacterium]